MLAWLASWLASAFMHMQRNTCLQTISGLCSIAENRFGRTHEIFIIWLWCAPYSSGDYNFEAGKSANETSKTKPKYCFGNYYSNRMKRRHHHRSGNLFTQLERLCYRYSHTECNAMSMECTKECQKKPRLTTIFASFTLHKICVVGLVSCIVGRTDFLFMSVLCIVFIVTFSACTQSSMSNPIQMIIEQTNAPNSAASKKQTNTHSLSIINR